MAEEIETTARWKQKYYDSLEQIERKEKQWSEVEGLLRRCISRLTMVASGSDPDLNQQIETLRNALRDGRDSLGLKNIIERFGDAVLR
ncbi:MAG: GGDEF domain-containing protein, partial [Gammaproteobacteria bacterium]